ncbi:hypothetical protein [Amycolatopsis thailandensis]|uniref:hypothetical protein n=1 Tax=Amycolatopsis thailandensis TaxID=589330 RepID=UPI00142DDE17|nr:hypothetical protein [Amycolatopsis thailandensis]
MQIAVTAQLRKISVLGSLATQFSLEPPAKTLTRVAFEAIDKNREPAMKAIRAPLRQSRLNMSRRECLFVSRAERDVARESAMASASVAALIFSVPSASKRLRISSWQVL